MRRQRGFTYLGLLYAVVLGSTALLAAAALWRTEAQRENEEQLLFAGEQIRAAIGAYWEKSPAGLPPALPRKLEDLLDDRRWPGTRRHLRRVYADPVTRSTDWALILAPDGGIVGVHSRSGEAPLKRAHFPEALKDFAGATSYREWRFVFTPSGRTPVASTAQGS